MRTLKLIKPGLTPLFSMRCTSSSGSSFCHAVRSGEFTCGRAPKQTESDAVRTYIGTEHSSKRRQRRDTPLFAASPSTPLFRRVFGQQQRAFLVLQAPRRVRFQRQALSAAVRLFRNALLEREACCFCHKPLHNLSRPGEK